MRYNHIVVFDLETGSNRKDDTEIVQIAAVAVDPRNLRVRHESAFNSLMRPLEPEKLQDEALRVNRKSRAELAVAPLPSEVWARFTTWVARWNLGGKSDRFCTPIAAGHNILNFDLPIVDRYCRRYGPIRTEKNGEEVPALFTGLYTYDTLQLMQYWTEDLKEPGKLGLDYLRKFLGMPKESLEGAHDALQDVRDTAAILVRLLGLTRRFGKRVVFKACFDAAAVELEIARRNQVSAGGRR